MLGTGAGEEGRLNVRSRAKLACGVATVALFAGACGADAKPPTIDPTGSVSEPIPLTFLAYGPEEEVAGMESMVAEFNEANPTVTVTLKSTAESENVISALTSADPPDVYLLSQRDIAKVSAEALNQPLDELLDARGVDFSDMYKRDAIQSYSLDNHLQCMPYGVSPMVVYYNADLIDFEDMATQGLQVPQLPETLGGRFTWTLDQFGAAATYASRVPGAKGVYIEPSLEGLASFIYSGGGQLFDDRANPTTLALSSDTSRDALLRTLDVLRTDQISPTKAELGAESALDMFKHGKLGMITGYRNLVPELRDAEGLNFNVMPMPVLDSTTSLGDVTGLCMSADPSSVANAADLIVHAVTAESVAEVAKAGYLVPANNEVAESEDFLQPDLEPANAQVFNAGIRDIVMPPLLESWDALEESVRPEFESLFYAPILDLEALTTRIDEKSAPVVADLVIRDEDKVTPSPTD